jgi:hypothetical protein
MRRADSLLEKIPPMPPLPEAHRVDPSASARMVKGINGGDGSKTPTVEEEDPMSPDSDMSSSSMKIISTPETRATDGDLSLSEDPSFSLTTPRAADRSSVPQAGSSTLPPPSSAHPESAQSLDPATPASLQVYLQLGRQVKRCRLETPVTFEGLRLLFMEKFEYDSGLGDFPDVYVRDPVSGVGYELEEMEDVREGSVLSLNIERESLSIEFRRDVRKELIPSARPSQAAL